MQQYMIYMERIISDEMAQICAFDKTRKHFLKTLTESYFLQSMQKSRHKADFSRIFLQKNFKYTLKSISFKNNLKNSEMSKIYMILPRSIVIVLICTTTYKAVFLRVHYHYLTVLLTC